jgi:hypothetical protein
VVPALDALVRLLDFVKTGSSKTEKVAVELIVVRRAVAMSIEVEKSVAFQLMNAPQNRGAAPVSVEWLPPMDGASVRY